jgi:hypothetical protein
MVYVGVGCGVSVGVAAPAVADGAEAAVFSDVATTTVTPAVGFAETSQAAASSGSHQKSARTARGRLWFGIFPPCVDPFQESGPRPAPTSCAAGSFAPAARLVAAGRRYQGMANSTVLF